MNILLIGSGGREHALAWKLKQSSKCSALYVAPGNAGTASIAANVALKATDTPGIKKFITDHQIRMVVVGPEEPLVNGLADAIRKDAAFSGIHVIGPGIAGAQLEGSKSFSKAFMQKHGIPTASYRRFDADTYEEGLACLASHSLPIVLKADGLAAGKGVLICQSHEEARDAFRSMIRDQKFGTAGNQVVVEEFLTGIEISIFILTDGKDFVLLPEAKDYKRIGEGDTGLNTGGMGAVSPVPFFTNDLRKKVTDRIILPTLKGLQADNIPYKGFIFFGLMINREGDPYVIEYNCRLGDPETEAVLPRLRTDLVELFLATDEGRLREVRAEIDPRSTAAVVAVSGGYPGDYSTGKTIRGLDVTLPSESLLFHAGTRTEKEAVLTSGGRVLVLTSYGDSIPAAAQRSVRALQDIHFDGMKYRSDIGYEFK
jgi:phosphoribosylamine--glycine ligase